MRPANTIIILSDEHNRNIAGCYGDANAITPNLDSMARNGTRFSNAYTNSPVCVPARASFATGRYPHQIGAWDSMSPYNGAVKGWGSRLMDAGHETVSIGKLHFRSTLDPNGFSQEIIPMHVHNGIGWPTSLLRNPPAPQGNVEGMANKIGPGESDYTHYDRDIAKRACDWISEAANRDHKKPWTLFVGFIAPHFPLIAPEEFYHLYDGIEIPPPSQYSPPERPQHPVLDALRKSSDYDAAFDDQKVRIARQSYYGLCSFLDDNIGKIFKAVEETGQEETTRIIYSSDHGDNLGNRGLWGKSVMYEDSVAVPLIIKGPDLPVAKIVDTSVSLVDLHQTIIDFAGCPRHEDDKDLPGTSLLEICQNPNPERSVFSEYHDWSSITGMFMLRKGDWKIVCYPGYPSQLFNLRKDPEERGDLSNKSDHESVLDMLWAELGKIVDIEAANKQAFADQAKKIKKYGGNIAIQKAESRGYTPPP